jgi:predicted nucleic acid-binding protein
VGRYFFDSSALAKLYQPEAGSDRVEAVFRQPQRRLIISRLTAVEMHSVFAGRVRMGTLSPVDAAALRNHFLSDVAAGVLTVVAIADRHYAEAERLLKQHGNIFRLRTLDALQLAVALDVHGRGSLDAVVAADNVVCQVGAAEGLPITNPESPS